MKIQKRYYKKFNGSTFDDVPITKIKKGDQFKLYDHQLEHEWKKLKALLEKYSDISIVFDEENIETLDRIISICEHSAKFRKLNTEKKVIWTATEDSEFDEKTTNFIKENRDNIENIGIIYEEKLYSVKAYNSYEGKDKILDLCEVFVK